MLENTQEEQSTLIKITPKFKSDLLGLMNKRPFKEVFQIINVLESGDTFSQKYVNTLANYLANFNYEEVKPFMDAMKTEFSVVDINGLPVAEDITVSAEETVTDEGPSCENDEQVKVS